MSEENVTQETENNDTLPDWAREQLEKANREAAKYRTEKKDAVEAAKAEVTEHYNAKIGELEALINEHKAGEASALHEVEKLKVALGSGVESDKVVRFAGLLKGETEAELRSHADELKELFAAPERGRATDSTQGNVPTMPLNGDPLLDAVKRKLNI